MKRNGIHSIFVWIVSPFRDRSWFLYPESRIPGIHKCTGIGYFRLVLWCREFSHSVYIKKLDIQHRISKFLRSWKLWEKISKSGYRLQIAIFLPFWPNGHQFKLFFGTEHDFCLKTFPKKKVMFFMFSDVICFKRQKSREVFEKNKHVSIV